MQMRDCHDENSVIGMAINDTVREAIDQTPTGTPTQSRASLRKTLDLRQGFANGRSIPGAQA
ncbi:hypothetical protein SAJA_11865 [Salinisphaera japonica YTM-1]|uniref:Uncharacterized protein n=1 Tax=Salinisphaera japonica YTM-1 TaxID=1209778 RepID=A0A423PK70_9GAMM|nr:hypothetical protein SAJA_11865 [Salinisphaera japonica YTM-1]